MGQLIQTGVATYKKSAPSEHGFFAVCCPGHDPDGAAYLRFAYVLPRSRKHTETPKISQCGNSIAIAECPVHELEHHLHQSHRFKIFYHTLELFGLCPDCYKASKLQAAD